MFCKSTAHRYCALFVTFTLLVPACGALSDEPRYVAEVHFNTEGDVLISAQGLVAAFDPEFTRKRFSFEHEPKLDLIEQDQVLDVSTEGDVGAVGLEDSVILFNAQNGKHMFTLGPANLDVRPDLPILRQRSLAVSPN